ncbi:amino acid adenylation domain-containing protein [Pedobacter sp. AW31-3R]|uniref:amino acid adenylation domain-containing protein n=1 Tax=Pedobacter sp. AW31-3R TaxID=3445781 RepID=UPI003F9ED784
MNKYREYWSAQLATVLPILDLAADTLPLRETQNKQEPIHKKIDSHLLKRFQTFTKDRNSSMQAGILALVNLLLFRYTQQEDIIVGNAHNGILPIRTLIKKEFPFDFLLENIQESLHQLFENTGYTYQDILKDLKLEGSQQQHPLFKVTFQYDETPTEIVVQEYTCPLSFAFNTSTETLVITFDDSIFNVDKIIGMSNHFVQLMESVLKTSGNSIEQLEFLSDEERQQQLINFNQTQTPYPEEQTLVSLFEHQVETRPDVTALIFEKRQFTFKELNEKANQLARYLRDSYPIQNDDLIGIKLTRNEWMVISILAVLKSGAAYVPIDPEYPQERIDYIVTDSKCKLLIDENELNLFKKKEIQYSGGNLPLMNQPGDLVYVIYTSGSTGNPKGCMIEHKSVINRIAWMWGHYGFNHSDVILQKTTFTFDVSVPEIFGPLCWGATMVLCHKDDIGSPERLLTLISLHKVTSTHFVPVMLNAFINDFEDNKSLAEQMSSLRRVFSSGEALAIQTVKNWYSLLNTPLFNLYGPTETSIEVTYFDTDKNDITIPIGKPIWNTNIYILSNNRDLLPVGAIGEIYIGGAGLSRGYLNKPEMTAERFIPNPFISDSRIYRSGDLGRWLPDGNIEYIGRIDEQVKIRGYRIELGEIESAIQSSPEIQSAVVTVRENAIGEKRLLAYVTTYDQVFHPAQLRKYLEKKLPGYMVPSSFVRLERFPQTPSGKIDKKALPAPERKRPEITVLYKTPKTDMEKKIAALWATLLELDAIGVNDNFFELGGNSLLALKNVAKLRSQYHLILPVTKLYQFPTVREVVSYLGFDKTTKPKTKKKQQSKNVDQAVAIIGMAAKFPGADTIDELWEVLCKGKETITFFNDDELHSSISSESRKDPHYVKARGIIRDAEMFDPEFFGLNPKLAELMDPQQRVFMELSRDVLEKTGYLPAYYDGITGVFAGSGYNTYFFNNVQHHPELVDTIGSFQVNTVNEKDYISSRAAYQLDLKGPAVSVFSACSTSLLAVAQAVDSIRNGQCDIAIAGAASITSPIHSGHYYQEGAMLSKDGHCRSFDENATGTVFSDGAGVVLLKNLAAAKADGDTIYAVIKGVGVNNDGKSKGSFTAPSTSGQAAAITMAMEDAGIAPATITYIEAHGTGTPLGDPIEIEGLKQAFGDLQEHSFCAIGSIKSNMGHLTAAAGVAGLIKTALALYYKKIPASINFEKANPNIDFENSPFYVNTSLKSWDTDAVRRAGVSSFGVGGTNVHVVVEESEHEMPVNTDTGRTKQLITWSAHTKESLAGYAAAFKEVLTSDRQISLPDAAYTLQTTREEFNHRGFIVSGSAEELLIALSAPAPASSVTKLISQPEETVFLFPGQGAQYLNMAKELYLQEASFKEHVDECAGILSHYLDKDIRSVLYPAENIVDTDEINDTKYTQPALFVIEYALAKLWMSWGIQPSILCGHSIGEYVAAHLAGVFSLEDGLRLIACRGRMVSELPPGSMLSVRTSREEIEKILPPTLSLAAVNSPKLCVVAGIDEDINIFISVLESRQILHKKLATSHAFHSYMMDPVLEDFAAVVKNVQLNKPLKPVVSTVTGSFLTDTEAQDPVYWTEHLRKTVQFSKAIETIMELDSPIFIEMGPGNTCTTLVWQHGKKNEIHAVPGIIRKQTEVTDQEAPGADEAILQALGKVWLYGLTPDWNAFYGTQQRQRIDIPGYIYHKKKCWVEPQITEKNRILQPVLETGNTNMRKDTLIEKIKEILENASGIEMEGLTADLNFIEIGLDSLLLTQVAITLKKEFGLPITFRQLNDEYGTIDALANYIDQSLAPETADSTKVNPMPAQAPIQHHSINYGAPADTALGLIAQQLQLLGKQVELLTGTRQEIAPDRTGFMPVSVSTVPQHVQQNDLSAQEQLEIKKPFGAIARIEKITAGLLPQQQQFLEELTKNYNQKTAKSKAYTQENRAHMADPRVVSGFKPATKELVYSIVVNKSQGANLWDIDGNKYIDALNGFGSSMLGYQPEIIKEALIAQIEKGYEIGPQHELSGEVTRLVCEFTGFDRAGLCNTGSEAVLGSMRIARTVTGKSLIVAFTGSYHGIIDEVIVRGTKKLKTFPAAPGIMQEAVGNMLILDYGTDEALQIIRERANEIAAVLVEPVQSRRPDFFPLDFLKELRVITENAGSALIFDEVISGFRFHPGGIQGMFGIKADLATYGKVAGGGISIGIIAGKSTFMDALDGGQWQYGDASVPEIGVTYFAGTFVRHPLALATTKASLGYMKTQGARLQEELNEKGRVLAEQLNEICFKLSVPIEIVHFGSLWRLKFLKDYAYYELLFTLMRYKGIHILDGFPCFLTTAHSYNDIQRITEVFEESLKELKNVNFIPEQDKKEIDFNFPPVPGARLGKDNEGNPAWFIADKNNTGKYLQITN